MYKFRSGAQDPMSDEPEEEYQELSKQRKGIEQEQVEHIKDAIYTGPI